MAVRAAHMAGFGLIALIGACGPVPVAQAERSCLRDARLAQAPRGDVSLGVGIGSGGVSPMGRVSVEMSSDYLMGRDPAEVFDRCVMKRSGQRPTRPLAQQPGWF